MAIITKPVSIDKGTENVITLNKADLASDTKVVADSYFSDQNNWNKIFITYKTPEGNQVNDVAFDASEATPVGSFNPSLKARDTWEVQSITILDFDNGSLKLLRGDLTIGDFDVFLGGIVDLVDNSSDLGSLNTGTTITASSSSKGQTFQLASNASVSEIILGLGTYGSWTGGVKVEIFDDPARTTLLGTSDTILNAGLPATSTAEAVTFVFASPVALSGSTEYYMHISYSAGTSGVTAFNAIGVGSTQTDNYANGTGYNGVNPLAFDYYFVIRG